MTRVRSHHGTRSRYLAGCRCDDCRQANSNYITEWRKTRTDEQRHRDQVQERLREKARLIVARRHRAEYEQVLAELREQVSA